MIGLLTGVFSLYRLKENRDRNELVTRSIAERTEEIQRLKGEGEKVQQLLTADQRQVLVASHKLVANKRFGWSRLFADLEAVLPNSVSASRISVVNIFQDGQRTRAELEVAVKSRDYAAVMAMIENMNNSGLFAAELRSQDRQTNERITFTEYTFRIVYSPAFGFSADPTDVARAGNTEGGQ
jgi:Tfp pilus assembly protein PilN